jgi:hypothetical protein
VFGLNEPANLRITATTFKDGDPSYAGALGGIALGLTSYHIFELEDEVPAEIWAEEMEFEVLQAGDELVDELCATMRAVRGA